ncbi:MAG: XrtA-associated tyrosine autokinase [Gammaproteobacteria bacterium]|nr:XrtA-associated tyrosine autokinase [Gammaproteobacteria bacterium]
MGTIEKAMQKLQATPNVILDADAGALVKPSSAATSELPRRAPIELDFSRFKSMNLLMPEVVHDPLLEEFRRIKRPILRNAFGQERNSNGHRNVVMVTSSVAGEGKTYTSINLALSITLELDRTVLLVDTDVIKPSITSYLGIDAQQGLVDYLLGESTDVADYFIKTSIPNLSILPAGRKERRTAELLASGRMSALVEELATRYSDRIVIFDAPPLLQTSEAGVLANLVGQVVVVVEANQTEKSTLKDALALLDKTRDVSLVLNKAERARSSGYYGDYGVES